MIKAPEDPFIAWAASLKATIKTEAIKETRQKRDALRTQRKWKESFVCPCKEVESGY